MDQLSRQNHKPMEGESRTSRFESDTQKLARRHMADPQHVITDEELQSIRIGMAPPTSEPPRLAKDSD